jgi:RNA polymerase sigma factor (sigma-70 family)
MAFDYATVSIEKSAAPGNPESESWVRGIDEGRLVAAAKRGETSAFDELWQAHAKRILRTTYRITRNRQDAEDALQDSFLNAFLHVHNFDGRSSFSTWLTRIAINAALMILRKRGSALELSLNDPGPGGNPEFVNVPDRAPNPEAHCAQRQREEILRDAIRTLRPTIRRALELKKLQEYSLKETAQMMGVTVTAAKSRLHHAKTQLRHSLRPKSIRRARGAGRFHLLPAA